jgi:hypothetical protein
MPSGDLLDDLLEGHVPPCPQGLPHGRIAGSVGVMKQILLIVGAVVLFVSAVWSIRSCSQRAESAQGLPRGVEYVFRCRVDQTEFKLTPKQMNDAFATGDVKGSGDGLDLFKCPKCGKHEAIQGLKGAE